MIRVIPRLNARFEAWLRRRLITWLGVDRAMASAASAEGHAAAMRREIMESERVMIDLGSHRSDTTVIVASQLNGGRVHVLHMNFGSLREFTDFMDSHFPGWRRPRGRNDHAHLFDLPFGAGRDFGL